MVGSIYEFHPCKTKQFNIFSQRMRMSDDSYLTIAVAKTLLKHYPIKYDEESVKELQSDLTKEFVDIWENTKTLDGADISLSGAKIVGIQVKLPNHIIPLEMEVR
jgi:hypothetical protein